MTIYKIYGATFNSLLPKNVFLGGRVRVSSARQCIVGGLKFFVPENALVFGTEAG